MHQESEPWDLLLVMAMPPVPFASASALPLTAVTRDHSPPTRPPPPEGCPSATSRAAGEDEEALAGPRGVDEPDLGARNHLLHLTGKRWAGAPIGVGACAWQRIIHVEP